MGCELLSAIVSQQQSFRVVGCATSSTKTVSLIRENQPDIALISMRLQDGTSAGLAALRMLRESLVRTRVVLLLDEDNPAAVVEGFRNRARALFCRSGASSALRKCISCVRKGQIWASNSQLEYLVEALGRTPAITVTPREAIPGLSKREEEVARLIAGGMSNAEVSKELGLSKHTVKNYVFHLFEKLGVSTRIELVLYILTHSKPGLAADNKPFLERTN